jgi:hypothetical protein
MICSGEVTERLSAASVASVCRSWESRVCWRSAAWVRDCFAAASSARLSGFDDIYTLSTDVICGAQRPFEAQDQHQINESVRATQITGSELCGPGLGLDTQSLLRRSRPGGRAWYRLAWCRVFCAGLCSRRLSPALDRTARKGTAGRSRIRARVAALPASSPRRIRARTLPTRSLCCWCTAGRRT